MKKQIQTLGLGLALAGMALAIQGCAYCTAKKLTDEDKKIVNETRSISGFDEITVATGVKVVFTQGPTEAMKISGPAHLVKRLEVNQHESELSVRLKSRNSFSSDFTTMNSDGVVVKVSSPVLEEVNVASGGLFETALLQRLQKIEISASSGGLVDIGRLGARSVDAAASSGGMVKVSETKAAKCEADASSGGMVTMLAVEADEVESSASSGGMARLEGKASRVDFSASSGGSLDARSLRAENADVEVSSGGSIKYNARTTRNDGREDVKNYWKE